MLFVFLERHIDMPLQIENKNLKSQIKELSREGAI